MGGTPSQIIFSQDASSLIVAVKGKLPMDLNNPSGELVPGYLSVYAIGENGSLAQEPETYPSAIPFSVEEDLFTPGLYFGSEVSKGYEAWKLGSDNKTVVGAIPDQGAVRLHKSQKSPY